MLHPFTYSVNSIGCTLGFDGHLLLFRELLVALSYKYPVPYLLLHTIPELWHAPRLPELCEPSDLERIVSLKEFWEKEAIPLLDFEVISAHFTFLSTVSTPYLYCDEFPKSFTELFLRLHLFWHKIFFCRKIFLRKSFYRKIFHDENIFRYLACTRKITNIFYVHNIKIQIYNNLKNKI